MKLTPGFIRRRIAHRPNLTRIVDNVGWLFFDKIVRMGVGLFVVAWLARYLGTEHFGQLNYAMAFASLFGAIATLGLQGIVVRDLVRDPESAHATLGTAFLLQVIGAFLAVGLMVIVVGWLRPDEVVTRAMVAIVGFALVFQASSVISYWFEAQVQSRYTVWTSNSVFVLISAVKILLIIYDAAVMAFAWVVLAEAILVAIGLTFVYIRQQAAFRMWQPSLAKSKSLLKASWPLILSGIGVMIYMRIDQVMLGEMLGLSSVGVYSAAARISELWYFVPIAIVSSVFPAMLKTKYSHQGLYLKRVQNLYNLLAVVSLAMALMVTMTADWIVVLVYGAQYSEAGLLLSIQVWAGIFVAMGVARGKWLLAENLQHIGYWYIGLAVVVNIAGNYILIPVYGTVGAAVATVVSQATAAIFAPALFVKTRVSAVMLLRSLNPYSWYVSLSERKTGW